MNEEWGDGCPSKANEDMKILFNDTDILAQHLRYHQIYNYAHTIFTYKALSYIYETIGDTHKWVMWMQLQPIYYHHIYCQSKHSKEWSCTLSHNHLQ